jgi:hypothetical protein
MPGLTVPLAKPQGKCQLHFTRKPRHPSESWGPFGGWRGHGVGMDASLRWHDGSSE